MALYKQVKESSPGYKTAVWWADFSVNGQRFRISLGTANTHKAKTIEKTKYAAARDGKLSAASASFARLAFKEAMEKYLADWQVRTSRKTRKRPCAATIKKETQLAVKLKEFFGVTRLNSIEATHVSEYELWRAKTCGPATINMEIGCLRRILKRAKLWHSIADEVAIPKPPDTIGRSLSPNEKAALLEAAALKPEWETAYLAATLALNTTMRGCEIKGLQWKDVDLLEDTLTIRKSKSDAGLRVIPLNHDALEVFVQLRQRAEMFGNVELNHYVFATFKLKDQPNGQPSRITAFDPSTPIKSWRTAWRKLTKKAGLPGLRFHDLRHHAITELLTNPSVSVQTAKSIAGHVSPRMIDRYAHIRTEAQKAAVKAFSGKGNVINHDIKSGPEQPPSPQVVDFIGRRVGI